MDIVLDDNGQAKILDYDEGNTVADMLQYVYLDPKNLIARYREQIEHSDLPVSEALQFLKELEEGLNGYTYLEEE